MTKITNVMYSIWRAILELTFTVILEENDFIKTLIVELGNVMGVDKII